MKKMVEDKLKTYEYYFSIVDLMLNDINNVTLSDINDVMDELHVEIKKIEEGKNNEMPTDNFDTDQNIFSK